MSTQVIWINVEQEKQGGGLHIYISKKYFTDVAII